MLESIGFLTILGVALYLLMMNTLSNQEKNKIEKEKIKNSYACQDLIYKYNKSLATEKPLMSNEMLRKKLREIINDPQEKERINTNILNREIEIKEAEEERLRNIKIGYKYDEQIFEIFDNNRELPKKEILQGISDKFRFNSIDESEKLFNLWSDHRLIKNCPWNTTNYEIGFISGRYSKTATDITYDDWIKEKKIILKPESYESEDYFNKFSYF